MPVLGFLVLLGLVLISLLFVADATLEPVSPVIVTSQRTGLPASRYDNANAIKTLATATAPAPDMTSQAVLAAQPKSASDAEIEPVAREARAEAPPTKLRTEVSAKARAEAQRHHQQSQFDRFSIKSY